MLLSWTDIADWIRFVREIRDELRCRTGRRRTSRSLLVQAVAEALPERYSAFVGFHGCRPTDVRTYYDRGLLRQSAQTQLESRKVAIEVTGASTAVVEQAIEHIDSGIDRGHVYVVLDPRELVEHATHYLIYGSEFTMAILAELARMGYPNDQYKLKNLGAPTLLTCHVPLWLVDDYEMNQIATTLVENSAELRFQVLRSAPLIHHTVTLKADLPPHCVVSHVNPNDLVDWHDHGSIYRWRAST